MTVGSDQGRDAPAVRSGRLGDIPSLAALFDDALPVVHRYLYASTAGDADLAEELTAATFELAVRSTAAGRSGEPALGTLLDTARSVLTARVVPLDPGVRQLPAASRHGDGSGPDPAAVLRHLPLGHRVALALRYHDHLPVEEVGRMLGLDPDGAASVVDDALAAVEADGGDGPGAPGWPAADERLRGTYAALAAPPRPAFAADLRARLNAEVEAVAPGAARGRTADLVADARVGSVTASAGGGDASPARDEPRTDPRPRTASDGDPAARPRAGPAPSVPPVRPPLPRQEGQRHGPRSTGGDDAGPLLPLEVVVAGDDRGPGTRPTAGGQRDGALLAQPDGGRLRRERTPRTWLAVAGVAVVIVAGLALAGAGGGGRGRDPAGPAGGGTAGGAAAAAESTPPGTVPLRAIAPAEHLGTVVPGVTSQARVIARAHLGPGGPYMNGPYAIAAGDEGLWATAVGDDGTWRAVRVDAETGETIAAVPIPGRIPSDRSHHGLALSGGYVWAPALRDGLFRIDAATNTPSGIVGVAGGVVGAALDGGDGAVWAVGNDSVLRRIDARTTAVTAAALIPEMGLMPDGVDLAYGGGTVWVSVGDAARRRLIGFDPVTLDRRYSYQIHPVGNVGDADDIAADGDRVVVTEAPPGGVTVIDGAEGRVLASHQMATAGIAVEGDRAWVLAPDEGRATVVWTRTGELLASTAVPVGVSDIVSTLDGGVWGAVPSTGDLVRLRFGG